MKNPRASTTLLPAPRPGGLALRPPSSSSPSPLPARSRVSASFHSSLFTVLLFFLGVQFSFLFFFPFFFFFSFLFFSFRFLFLLIQKGDPPATPGNERHHVIVQEALCLCFGPHDDYSQGASDDEEMHKEIRKGLGERHYKAVGKTLQGPEDLVGLD